MAMQWEPSQYLVGSLKGVELRDELLGEHEVSLVGKYGDIWLHSPGHYRAWEMRDGGEQIHKFLPHKFRYWTGRLGIPSDPFKQAEIANRPGRGNDTEGGKAVVATDPENRS
jgi:hypothetical protein